MLRKIVNVLVILPLAIVFVVFAVANRHLVTLSLDPFNSADPALGVTLPLFVVMIAAAMLGVIVGGIATWFGQRRWRQMARRHEAEIRDARLQLADLRGRPDVQGRSGERQVPATLRNDGLPAVQGPQYGAIGRDKHGATL